MCGIGSHGGVYEHYIVKLCFALHLVQIAHSIPVHELELEQESLQEEQHSHLLNDPKLLEYFQQFTSNNAKRLDLANRKGKVVVNRILRSALPFLRSTALLMRFVTCIEPDARLKRKIDDRNFLDEYSLLVKYLDLKNLTDTLAGRQ